MITYSYFGVHFVTCSVWLSILQTPWKLVLTCSFTECTFRWIKVVFNKMVIVWLKAIFTNSDKVMHLASHTCEEWSLQGYAVCKTKLIHYRFIIIITRELRPHCIKKRHDTYFKSYWPNQIKYITIAQNRTEKQGEFWKANRKMGDNKVNT